MSFFKEYLRQTDDRAVTKWLHYLPIYERELARYREKPITFLEIGIFRGGSLPMWKAFFAPGSKLVFVDIDPACAELSEPGTHIEIGNQADPEFLAGLAQKYGPFDVVIDDGSHLSAHQIASFAALWPALREDGLYIVEDCHTSYWRGFGGGFRQPESFVEYTKGLIDKMHSWYTEDPDRFPFDAIAREIHALRVFDSLIMIEKKWRQDPPTSFSSQNGIRRETRRALNQKSRVSSFRGKDGSSDG